MDELELDELGELDELELEDGTGFVDDDDEEEPMGEVGLSPHAINVPIVPPVSSNRKSRRSPSGREGPSSVRDRFLSFSVVNVFSPKRLLVAR
jgi:hypothetical protein